MSSALRELVDVNVNLSRWPLRRLPGDEPDKLVAKLRAQHVVQAWAGSFDGLLHRDVAGVNRRLAEQCRAHGAGLLVPFGTINPQLPDWQEDVRRCAVDHQMPGIRLHPNYHGYELTDPKFAELLRLAGGRGLVVQIVVTMDDERMQHPLLRVPHVDLQPLPELLPTVPNLSVVVLNAFRSMSIGQVATLAQAGRVYFDFAMLEGVGGLDKLLRDVPVDRVLFGSHFPLFCFESAHAKLRESAVSGKIAHAICSGNAQSLATQSR